MILSDKNRIGRTVKRMAYQIAEEAHGADIYLVGLNERGFALSKLLQQHLENSSNKSIPTESFQVYSGDSFTFNHDINENTVLVIIDDVIFSGETILNALDLIPNRDKFNKIFVSVLVDRGHRKYPIQAAVIGMNIPTKLNEQIDVGLKNGIPESIVLSEN